MGKSDKTEASDEVKTTATATQATNTTKKPYYLILRAKKRRILITRPRPGQ